MCRIIAREKSWEHTRKERRLILRQTASKRLRNGDVKYIEENVSNDKNISNTVLIMEKSDERSNNNSDAIMTVEESNVESASEENSKKEIFDDRIPILTCKLCIESSKCEEDNVFKMWMIYENGNGGLDALHSLRQYLINQLGVREKVIYNSSKGRKRKMRKTKRDVAGFAVPIAQSQTDNENSIKKENTNSFDDC
jgi:hypothetical protein